MKNYKYNSNPEFILTNIENGIVVVEENPVKIFVNGKEQNPTLNKRKRSERGDLRVHLYIKKERKSINVSHLIWMYHTRMPIPSGFEIHHIDENPENNNFNNLLCVHCLDHLKLHSTDEIPF